MSQKINKFYNRYFFELAEKLAKINLYKTKENPSVGCVVTDLKNNILSTGVTSATGRPHAEYNALFKLNKKIKKKLFVTLEPCNYFGKTPACTNLILKHSIQEMHFGDYDNNAIISGKSINLLKKQIKVIKQKFSKFFYQSYNYSVEKKIPYVCSKIATTKNFCTKVKKKKYFTNNQSLKFAHLLRYMNDSILVGFNTYIEDFPKLTCRINGLNSYSPKIFVINKNLIFFKKHLENSSKKTVIFHDCYNLNKIKKYQKYFTLCRIATVNGIMSPDQILQKIYEFKCRSLLLEGGVCTLNNFVKKKLINQNFVIISNIVCKKPRYSAKKFLSLFYGKEIMRYKQKINLLDNQLIKK